MFKKEIKKRLSEYSGLGNTLDIFIRRVCVTIVSKNSIPYLLKFVAKLRSSTGLDDTLYGNAAERIINVLIDPNSKDICLTLPGMYKSHSKKLLELLSEESEETGKSQLSKYSFGLLGGASSLMPCFSGGSTKGRVLFSLFIW
jgi:hypothetical protein